MTDVLIISLIGLIGTLIAVMTPIIKLNTNITTLNCNLEALASTIRRDEGELKEVKETVAQHELDICKARTDIKTLFRKTDDLENRRE